MRGVPWHSKLRRYMDHNRQKSVAAKMHDQAVKDGQTCDQLP